MEPSLATLTIEGREVEVARSLGEINMDDLTGEVAQAGGSAVWWGVLAAQAQALHQRSKLSTETVKAMTARRIRQEAASTGQKITEGGVAELIVLDPSVRDAEIALIAAEEKANILRVARFAAEQKARTLESLAGLVGQEITATRAPLVPRDQRDYQPTQPAPARRRQPVPI